MHNDKINVRYAQIRDLTGCAETDYGLPRRVIEQKITAQEIVIAEIQGQIVGYLRLDYLWSSIPYIALISVEEAHRRRGIGRAILAFVEAEARRQGRKVLLSSSQVDEPEPQAWHRHMGFAECGILAGINDGGIGEVFFRKVL